MLTDEMTDLERVLRTRPNDVRPWEKLFRTLPPHIEVGVLTQASLYFLDRDWWRFSRSAGNLPPAVIRGLLHAFSQAPRFAFAVFVQELLRSDSPDEVLTFEWRRALKNFLALNATAAFGSKLKTDKLTALAADPRVVSALRAVAVSTPASISVLGVLAIDASPESVDALLPRFVEVTSTASGLEWFHQLRKVAKRTPAMVSMLARVEGELAARGSTRRR